MGATWFFPPFRNMFKMLKDLKVELGEQYLKGYVMYESDPNSPPNKSYSKGDDEDMFRIKGGTKQEGGCQGPAGQSVRGGGWRHHRLQGHALGPGEVHCSRGRGREAETSPEQRPRPLPETGSGGSPDHCRDGDIARVRGVHGGGREQRQPCHEPHQQHYLNSVIWLLLSFFLSVFRAYQHSVPRHI